MGVGNNSSTKSLLSSFESAGNLDPSIRKVIQSLQDAVVNLQAEVQDLIKGGTPEQATYQSTKDQLSIEAGQGIKVISVCNRRVICNTQLNSTVSLLKELSVIKEFGDYLQCGTIVTSGEPEIVYVAKPYSFRKSIFDNQTINGLTYSYVVMTEGDPSEVNYRQATDGNEYELQRITPVYYQGERILVACQVNTGVVLDEKPLTMVDVNFSGRCWAVHISGEYTSSSEGDA